jgi:hypothetical protein
MMRVVLHIGVPKTGTTALQRRVFPHLPGIVYLGKPFFHEEAAGRRGVDRNRLESDIIRVVRDQDSIGYDGRDLKRRVDARLAELGATTVTLLSEEGLTSAGGVDRGLIASRLHDLFGDADIVITIRNQLTCLPSLFLHHMRKGTLPVQSFDDWVQAGLGSERSSGAADDWMIRQHDYFALYDLYRRMFPKSRISVLLYEQMLSKDAPFVAQLAGILGTDKDDIERLLNGAGRENVGYTAEAVGAFTIYRRLKRAYGRMRQRWMPWLELRRQAPIVVSGVEFMRNLAISRLNRNKDAGNPARMRDATREVLVRYFAPGNRKLAEACELPLSDYGYPL